MIRSANTTDATGITELMQQLGYTNTISFLNDKLSYLLKHPDYYVLVEEEQECIRGFIVLHIVFELGMNTNTGLIAYLVVDQHEQGKGIGKALEQQAIILARRRNCSRLQLHCSIHRIDAHIFYQRLGFEEWPKYFSKQLKE